MSKRNQSETIINIIDEKRIPPIVKILELAKTVKMLDSYFPSIFMYYWEQFEIHLANRYAQSETKIEYDPKFNIESEWILYYKTLNNPPIGLNNHILDIIRGK